VSSITSDTFNISVVNREHMGEYACNADNGIPPAKSKKFKLQVRCKHVSMLFNYLIYIYKNIIRNVHVNMYFSSLFINFFKILRYNIFILILLHLLP